MGSARRGASRGVTVVAAGVVLLAAPVGLGTATADTTVQMPGYFAVETAAAAVQFTQQQQPPVSPFSNQIFRDSLGYAASSLDSGGGSEALSAVFFPGTLVAQAPHLLCSQFLPMAQQQCPAEPPAYPLFADAQYPTNPSDAADVNGQEVGNDQLRGSAIRAVAKAAQTSNSAQSVVAGLGAAGGTPAALSVGTVTGHTTTTVDGQGVHVHVESVLHDVAIGGLVRISVLRAVDDVDVPEGGTPKNTPRITFGGVTVAGQAATLDEHGLHVAGQDGPGLVRQVAQQGIALDVVGTDVKNGPGSARSTAFGLRVSIQRAVDGAPPVCEPAPIPQVGSCVPDVNRTYVQTATLGSVGVVAVAQKSQDFSFAEFPSSVPGPDSFGTGGTFAPTGAGSSPALPPETASAPSSGSAPQVAAGNTGFSLLRVNLSTLYAVLALVTAAGFVGWRATTLLATSRRHA